MSRHDRKIAQTSKFEIAPETGRDADAVPQPPKRDIKRLLRGAVAIAALVGIGLFGHDYWTNGRFMIDTDDAYVTADITLISSRVQGYVAEVSVKQNDVVQQGDLLLRLDDGDFRIALDTARERVRTADQTAKRIEAQIEAAKAAVTQAEAMKAVAQAQLHSAQTGWERAQKLAKNKVVAQAQLDTAVEVLETTTAALANAEAAILNAKAQVGVLHAQQAEARGTRRELELAVKQAQRDLDLTILRAPADGTLANLTLEVGDLVNAGTRLAALVPLSGLYVEANFKETQLHDLAIGADVSLSFDAIPGAVFKGHVASLAPATGSVFSLLPADNATGNFTKIVQRVPVRIDLPADALQSGHLRAGLSATVEVDSRTGGEITALARTE